MLPEAAESPDGSGANLPDWSSVLEKTKIKTLDALLRLTPRTAPAEEALRVLKRFAVCGATLSCVLLAVAMLGRLTRPQLLFAAVLGVAGGMYIYQPIFEQYSRDQKELKEKVKLLQESEEKGS